MICPKCQNVMQTVNKNGIHIEQCQGCRGIFLDRGELEQIVGAENAYYAAAPPPYQGGMPGHHGDSPRPFRGGHGGHYGDSPRPYHGGHGGHYGDSPRPYRRKRSFLDDLFD